MIKGLRALKPTWIFDDERGDITELFNNANVKSVTHTRSKHRVLRGIHIQGWDRIVYPASGHVYSLFVDARKDSPTYGQSVSYTDVAGGRAYFVPKGVGNSYCVVGHEHINYFYFNFENFDAKQTRTISYRPYPYPVKAPIVSKDDAGCRLLV